VPKQYTTRDVVLTRLLTRSPIPHDQLADDLARKLQHDGEVEVDSGKVRLSERGRRAALEINRGQPTGSFCQSETAQGPCIRRPKEIVAAASGDRRRPLELCRQHARRLRAGTIRLKGGSDWTLDTDPPPPTLSTGGVMGPVERDLLWAELIERNPPTTIPELVRSRDRNHRGRARSIGGRLLRISDQLPTGPLRDEVLVAMVRAYDLSEDLSPARARSREPA
jgi:hypothetical protein